VKQMAIETLVSGELVRLEINARNIKPKKADVDAAIANMKNQAGGEKNLNEYIKKMGLSQASFTKKIEEQLASEQILSQVIPAPKEPTDADRLKFFNENKSKLPINDTIAGYQIYLKSDANDNADSLEAKKDLLNGWAAMVRAKKADIRQLAAEYSDDPQAKKDGGVVEPAPLKSFGAQMEQVVKTLKVGEVSKAFNGKNGLTIFMLAEKNDGTFESNKYKIDMALRMQQEQEYAEKIKTFVGGLAKKYNVQYLDARYKPTAQGAAPSSLKPNLNIK
jgi:peptidyl-prolyl cis-trans isomerase SurA